MQVYYMIYYYNDYLKVLLNLHNCQLQELMDQELSHTASTHSTNDATIMVSIIW